MLRKTVLGLALAFGTPAVAHHAACVTASDGFMTCGAHSGRVSFDLQNFGPVTKNTRQLLLCNAQGAKVESLNFRWVESEDESTHFDMGTLSFREVSDTCVMIGGLDFTPPASHKDAEMNAWKLVINIEGIDIPSAVYVEAMPEGLE